MRWFIFLFSNGKIRKKSEHTKYIGKDVITNHHTNREEEPYKKSKENNYYNIEFHISYTVS